MRNRGAGFTLIELMIVVVILGVLAAIATVGYRKYIARARLTEASAMLAEMKSKEEMYFLEFAGYQPLRTDNQVPPNTNEPAAAFYPSNPVAATFDSARTATLINNPALWPQGWRTVGLRPKADALYCTYLVNAGAAGQATPAGASYGSRVLGATPQLPWFYVIGVCNLSGTPSAADFSDSSVLLLSSNSPRLVTINDGR